MTGLFIEHPHSIFSRMPRFRIGGIEPQHPVVAPVDEHAMIRDVVQKAVLRRFGMKLKRGCVSSCSGKRAARSIPRLAGTRVLEIAAFGSSGA